MDSSTPLVPSRAAESGKGQRRIKVEVPAGAVPGQSMDVQVEGHKFRFTVPTGARPGNIVNLTLAASPANNPITRPSTMDPLTLAALPPPPPPPRSLPSDPPSSMTSEGSILQLMEMGFSRDAAVEALVANHGDSERALNSLLTADETAALQASFH